MTSTAAPATTRRGAPTFAQLIGVVFGVCVVAMSISIVIEMQLGYVGQGEQPRSLGEQLAGVVGFGTGALVVSLVGAHLATARGRTPIGAVVFGVLAVLSLPFFWCGMPGMFGATAAHLAGLTRDGHSGSRTVGLLGLVLAVVNPLVTFLGLSISWIASAL